MRLISAVAVFAACSLLLACPADDRPDADTVQTDADAAQADADTAEPDADAPDTEGPDTDAPDTAENVDDADAADTAGADGDAEPGDADAPDATPDTSPPACATAADCDDGNPCTADLCDDGTCAASPVPGPCDDGQPCTVDDTCRFSACRGRPMDCDDDNPCTLDACAAGACTHAARTGPCDDGDPCTSDDVCGDGACGGAPVACDDGNPCTLDACDEGACRHAPAPAMPCDDGDPCTADDACFQGRCAGVPNPCDDGDPCTLDRCGPGGCRHAAHTGPCDDTNACTGLDRCNADGVCVGVPRSCDDGDPCTADSCVDGVGCVNTLLDACCGDGLCAAGEGCGSCPGDCPCDAPNLCTVASCQGNACTLAPRVCDDGEPATLDGCSLATGCTTQPGPYCGDGQCDHGETCAADCQPSCPDGQCTANETAASCPADCGPLCGNGVCNPSEDCLSCPKDCGCGAGDACTREVCVGGACVSRPLLDCDDGVSCTNDSCDPEDGCVNTVTGACCGDGVCTPEAGETAGSCGADCVAGPCCEAHAGPGCGVAPCVACVCQLLPSCCSEGWSSLCAQVARVGCPAECPACGACGDEVCAPQAGETCDSCPEDCGCDDANACTTDSCVDPGSGFRCQSAPSPGCCGNGVCEPADDEDCRTCPTDCGCDDGDACTNDRCVAGACQVGPATRCDDGNPCTVDACDAAVGCVFSPVAAGTPCDDADVCTLTSACSAQGVCQGTGQSCDDGNPCTDDRCDPQDGCVHVPALAGGGCDDGDPCTSGDVCAAGVCVGTNPCDDGNPCTRDCVSGGQCQHTNANGVACEDGDPCTDGDLCQGGSCRAGGPRDCDDGNACTAETCISAQGGCVYEAYDPICLEPDSVCVGAWCYVEGACGDGWCDETERHASWPPSTGANVCNVDCLPQCYGSHALCRRTLYDLTLAGTHNSNAAFEYGFLPASATQTYSLTQQLEDGVRSMQIDITDCQDWPEWLGILPAGELCLCHGDVCDLGGFVASVGLAEIARWLEANPSEVLILSLEAKVADKQDVVDAFEAAGLLAHLAEPPMTYCPSWDPTCVPEELLGCTEEERTADACHPDPERWPYPYPWNAMAVRDKRLFVFGADISPSYVARSWHGTLSWEEQRCENRNPQNGALALPRDWELYRLQHSRSSIFELPDFVASTCANTTDYLTDVVAQCQGETDHRINLIQVDFHDSGPGVYEVVNMLNGVEHLAVPYQDQCAEVPNLLPCMGDFQCASGICSDAFVCVGCETNADCGAGRYCHNVLFNCFDKAADGAVCGADEECLSGDCHRFFCANCHGDGDCDGGEFCDSVTSVCKPKLDAGAVCIRDGVCASGTCYGYCADCDSNADCAEDAYCLAGVCAPDLDNGFFCSRDAECRSGHCDVVCVACEQDGHCGAGEFCDLFGACVPQGGLGDFCSADGDCTSGHCAELAGLGACVACESDNHCAGGEFCDTFTFECEALGGNGAFCSANSECASGHCVEVLGLGGCVACESGSHCGSGEFCGADWTCKAKKGNGSACVTGGECSSGTCCLLSCKSSCWP
ncbi:MAG: hypothetical protein EP329_23480 [Deltaproteobacteria bacterium]|nr:MAG: hypothetical protein EP329_23480 [Deltaproteobacteria bacterium]